MKCPHCHRTWTDDECEGAGLTPTLILSDHVQRFCPGVPRLAPAQGKRRAQPRPLR
jgi:hypothetical protein